MIDLMLVYYLLYSKWQMTVGFVVAEMMTDKVSWRAPKLPVRCIVADIYVTSRIRLVDRAKASLF